MSNSIRIKRRAASGDSGAPASLKNGELAYNEADNNLYYGFGDNGSGVATSVPIVGGVLDELLQDIADISGTATAADQVIISTAAGQLALESGATLRTSLGVDAAGTDNSTNVTLAGGSKDYITLSGQALTINQIDLTDDVTGSLPDANIAGMAASKLSGTVPSARLPQATTTAKGAIEIFSATAQSVSANAVTTAAGKTYGIQLNSAGQAVVNVPWANDQTPVRPVKVGSNNLTSSETLEIVGGTNVTVTETGGVVTFNSTATATKASLGLDGDDDVAFGNLELGSGESTATLKGPATFTIDPAAHGDDTGKVVIAGDLQVDGTTTTINSTVVEIDDLAIELAHDATSLSAINNAGIKIGTGPSAGLVEFIYSNANGRMELSSALRIIGGLKDTVIDGGTF